MGDCGHCFLGIVAWHVEVMFSQMAMFSQMTMFSQMAMLCQICLSVNLGDCCICSQVCCIGCQVCM